MFRTLHLRLRRSHRRLLPLVWAACAILVGLASANTGVATAIDQQLRNARDALIARPATGEVVLVEIDARSLHTIARWPWPRRVYGDAIDRLRESGAKVIAFDVDLSSPSSAREDQALAAALDRAGGAVALPTFIQSQSLGDSLALENLPAPAFRDRAFLAAVNVFPDADGVVRSYPYGIRTGGSPRPSLSALVAEQQGAIGQSFVIDQSIDPKSIPRVSFADLVARRIPPAALSDKRVIIGATAIELGDRYSIPRHGVVPGALIQAQAAETLLQGRALGSAGPLVPLFLALLAMVAIFSARDFRRQLALAIGAAAVTFAAVLGLEHLAIGTAEIAPALVALTVGILMALALRLASAFERARLLDRETGLGNATALGADMQKAGPSTIAVARISRFAELASLLTAEDLAALVGNVANRASYVALDKTVYRVDEGVLAWRTASDDLTVLSDGMEGLAALLRAPVLVSGRSVEVRATFGVATDQADAHAAVAKALLAADAAATSGERWRLHNEHLDEQADWNVTLLGEIEDAMANGQIWVAYQPKFDPKREAVTGAEALVRWRHPTRGIIPPDRFIPVIENDGDILGLTLFVLRDALRTQRAWSKAGHDIGVAVNISAAILRKPALARAIEKLMAEERIDPAKLTLEVTESAAMGEQAISLAALERLRALGVRLSIDDYGTGQSTLTYLRRVPANEIKIDKSFILGVTSNRSDEILVRSTIDLAHELGLTVVAEGVETIEIQQKLCDLGCDMLQGWHIGKPIAAADFIGAFAQPLPQAA